MTKRSIYLLSGILAAGLAMPAVSNAQETVLYSTDFETDASGDFTVVQTTGRTDFAADFSYDYSTFAQAGGGFPTSIPASPNSSSGTTALRMDVNTADGALMTAVSYLNGLSVDFNSINFLTVKFDLWINYNGAAGGGSGSTEFFITGLMDSTDPVESTANGATDPPGINVPGVYVGSTGEGGAGQDWRFYEGTASSGFAKSDDVGWNAPDIADDGDDNSEWVSLFAAPAYETAGAIGKAWNQVEIQYLASGVVNWYITPSGGTRTLIVSSVLNNDTPLGSNVFIGAMDVFASLADPASDNFVLFDNLEVSTTTQTNAESWSLYE